MIHPDLYNACQKVQLRPASKPNDDCPWCNGNEYRCYDQVLCLHREILDFAQWIQPTSEEIQFRTIVIQRLRTALKMLWPGASILCHGSTATKTYLPNGDLDFVVINAPDEAEVELLTELNDHLLSVSMFRKSEVIKNAKCPIIKAIEKPFGFHLDIAINNFNGILNIQRNLNLMKAFPQIYPLFIFLKLFLYQNRLNEPYHGGISSNTLQQMILFIIQCARPIHKMNLGALLMLFLQTFGVSFNYIATGISTRFNGRLFARWDVEEINWKSPINICVEDPQIPGRFIGENAFESSVFRSRCYSAFNKLKREQNDQSMLLRIINRPEILIKQRNEFKKAFKALQGEALKSIPLNSSDVEDDYHKKNTNKNIENRSVVYQQTNVYRNNNRYSSNTSIGRNNIYFSNRNYMNTSVAIHDYSNRNQGYNRNGQRMPYRR